MAFPQISSGDPAPALQLIQTTHDLIDKADQICSLVEAIERSLVGRSIVAEHDKSPQPVTTPKGYSEDEMPPAIPGAVDRMRYMMRRLDAAVTGLKSLERDISGEGPSPGVPAYGGPLDGPKDMGARYHR